MGFEPTDRFSDSTGFKSVAVTQTLSAEPSSWQRVRDSNPRRAAFTTLTSFPSPRLKPLGQPAMVVGIEGIEPTRYLKATEFTAPAVSLTVYIPE